MLQHWRDEDYRAWKSGLLSHALRQAGFLAPDPLDYVPGQPGERRRVDFAVRRAAGRIILGLHKQRSSEVIDLTECLVLHPRLMGLMEPLRALLLGLRAVRREASVVINLLESGPDMLLRTDAALTLEDRVALAEFAAAHGLPRVSQVLGDDVPETIATAAFPHHSAVRGRGQAAARGVSASHGGGRAGDRRCGAAGDAGEAHRQDAGC